MTNFLRGADGDPIKLRRQICTQPTEDLAPDDADYREFWSNGGPVVVTPDTIAPEVILASAKRPDDLLGKINISNGPMALGTANPADPALRVLAANILRASTDTAIVSGRRRLQIGLD